jgi:hypothetical protein
LRRRCGQNSIGNRPQGACVEEHRIAFSLTQEHGMSLLSYLPSRQSVGTLCTGIVCALALTGLKGKTRFTEIDVERINVIDSAGGIRMVISNRERSPRIMHRGTPIGRAGGGRPGMIFYNDEGTESGGLLFAGATVNGRTSSSGSLTLDQYERDQTVALQTVESDGTRRAGLSVIDYAGPTTAELVRRGDSIARLPAGAQRNAARRELRALGAGRMRVYVGRSRDDGASLVSLSAGDGSERLRLSVDTAGVAVIEFLNDSGRVVKRIGAANP